MPGSEEYEAMALKAIKDGASDRGIVYATLALNAGRREQNAKTDALIDSLIPYITQMFGMLTGTQDAIP